MSATTVTLATATTETVPVITFAKVTRRGRCDRHGQARVPSLDKRVHGVDGRWGLRALVAFVRVFLFLAAVLADEGAVFIELSVPALPVVHQAVVALVTAHRPIGRRPAALQRLVVLRVTIEGRKKVGRKVIEKIVLAVCQSFFAVVRNPGATQRAGYYSSVSILHELSGFSTAQIPHIVCIRIYCC